LGILALALGSLIPDLDHPRSLGSKAFTHIPLSHRGLTHSLAALYALGYLAHLALDRLTPTGVAWLAPLTNRRVEGPLKTNGVADHAQFTSF